MLARVVIGVTFLAMATLAARADTTRDPPPCNGEYARAIAMAEQRDDTDTLDLLKELQPVFLDPSPKPSCLMYILGSRDRLGKLNERMEGVYFDVHVSGGVAMAAPQSAYWLHHRADLLSGLPPRKGPTGERGAYNQFSFYYYGLNYLALTPEVLYQLHPVRWWSAWTLAFAIPAVFAVTLWFCFFLAARSGEGKRLALTALFYRAHIDALREAGEIGGAQWKLGLHGFLRQSRFGSETHNERLVEMGGLELGAGILSIAPPAAILFVTFFGADLHELTTAQLIDWFVANASWYILLTLLALLGIGLEFFRRTGRQDIWGAMVLDLPPEHLRPYLFAKLQHGRDADEASEKDTLEAAGGRVRRSSVHDQQF